MRAQPRGLEEGSRMSRSPHQERGSEVSRRTVLSGAAAAAAVGASEIPAYARTAGASSSQDMMAFLLLSSALTGVQISTLAPEFSKDKTKPDILDADPGVDPFNVKKDYFNWI